MTVDSVETADSIRQRFRSVANLRRRDTYTCPVLGTLRIQSLTEFERMTIELKKYGNDGKPDEVEIGLQTARFVVATVVDADDNRVFSDGDVETIAEIDTKFLSPLRDAINAHVIGNANDDEAEEAAKND